MSAQTVRDLIGEDLRSDPLGEDMAGSLTAGYIPGRDVRYLPPVQLGDGLAGPPNQQQLKIYRDARPIATDELGMQGPFYLRIGAIARHRAGRSFPLNYQWGAGLDPTLPGRVPTQESRELSPFGPGMLPDTHAGVAPVELTPTARTVYYTATPMVGWQGY